MALTARRPASLAAAIVLAAGGAFAGEAPAARAAVVFSGPTMGTRYTVRVVMAPGDAVENDRVRSAIDRELAVADRLFSPWSPASEISRLNAHASAAPFPASAELIAALALAQRAAELSGGAFDPTVAPLVDAWGFGPSEKPPSVPAPAALTALRSRVGYRQLSLDAARRTVTKARPDVACDLSALAGGWAADRLVAAIAALGHEDALAEVGGEVSARGRRPDGSRWRVAVEAPQGGKVAAVLVLEDRAVATSGDTRKAWTDPQGRRRSHVIDPRTGEPIANGLAAATVIDRDAAWADALATALLVLGPDAGRALATRQRLAARLVLRQPDGTHAEWWTPAFEAAVAPAR